MSTHVAEHQLLTRQELADLLRVSPRTVDRYAALGVIDRVRLVPGGGVRFRRADVEQLLRAGER